MTLLWIASCALCLYAGFRLGVQGIALKEEMNPEDYRTFKSMLDKKEK